MCCVLHVSPKGSFRSEGRWYVEKYPVETILSVKKFASILIGNGCIYRLVLGHEDKSKTFSSPCENSSKSV